MSRADSSVGNSLALLESKVTLPRGHYFAVDPTTSVAVSEIGDNAVEGWQSEGAVDSKTAQRFTFDALTHYKDTGLWPVVSSQFADITEVSVDQLQKGDQLFGDHSRLFDEASWRISEKEVSRWFQGEFVNRKWTLYLFSVKCPLSVSSAVMPVRKDGLSPLANYAIGPVVFAENLAILVEVDNPDLLPPFRVIQRVALATSDELDFDDTTDTRVFTYIWNN
jgi:hypothetical protein